MSMLDDAADETKDAIKEAQRRRQEADDRGAGDREADAGGGEPSATLPLSDIAGRIEDTLSGASGDAWDEEHLGAEANAELMDPEAGQDEEQRQPRHDQGDAEEGLDRPRAPEDPGQEDPASADLDPSRVEGDPGEDDM